MHAASPWPSRLENSELSKVVWSNQRHERLAPSRCSICLRSLSWFILMSSWSQIWRRDGACEFIWKNMYLRVTFLDVDRILDLMLSRSACFLILYSWSAWRWAISLGSPFWALFTRRFSTENHSKDQWNTCTAHYPPFLSTCLMYKLFCRAPEVYSRQVHVCKTQMELAVIVGNVIIKLFQTCPDQNNTLWSISD